MWGSNNKTWIRTSNMLCLYITFGYIIKLRIIIWRDFAMLTILKKASGIYDIIIITANQSQNRELRETHQIPQEFKLF